MSGVEIAEALAKALHNEGDGGIWEHFDRANADAVARALVPTVERIVAARLAPIEALADMWSSPESLRHGAWIRERDVADRIRDALKAAR